MAAPLTGGRSARDATGRGSRNGHGLWRCGLGVRGIDSGGCGLAVGRDLVGFTARASVLACNATPPESASDCALLASAEADFKLVMACKMGTPV